MSRITDLLPPEDPPSVGFSQGSIELRPCPFCGGAAEFSHPSPPDDENPEIGYMVQCAGNDCEVCVIAGPCETADEAIKIWNTRKGWKL